MAVTDFVQAIEFSLQELKPTVETASQPEEYSGYAVFDGSQWASLCPAIDVASCGTTATEALDALEDAVRSVVTVARTEGLSLMSPLSPEGVRDFLLGHQGKHAVVGRNFRV